MSQGTANQVTTKTEKIRVQEELQLPVLDEGDWTE